MQTGRGTPPNRRFLGAPEAILTDFISLGGRELAIYWATWYPIFAVF